MNKAEGLPEVGRSSDSRVLTSARVAGSKQGRLLSEQTRAQAGMWPWKLAAMLGGCREHGQIQQLFECWDEMFSSVLGRSSW